MPDETTNVMILTLTAASTVKTDPSELRVLARRGEVVLRGDPRNAADIEVSFVRRNAAGRRIAADPADIFVASSIPPLPIKVKKGTPVRLKIRQDLTIRPRGRAFVDDHDPAFSRAIDLKFNFPRDDSGDHGDWHIEC
ncbi:MAG: hypothetical protein ACRD8O_07485 [Bryobacteraceae bacterium]